MNAMNGLNKDEQNKLNDEIMSDIADIIEKKLGVKVRKIKFGKDEDTIPFMTIGFMLENEKIENSFSIGCMGWFSEELSIAFTDEYKSASRLFYYTEEERKQIIESYKKQKEIEEKENPSYA